MIARRADRAWVRGAAFVLVLLLLFAALTRLPAGGLARASTAGVHDHGAMSADAMERRVREWYSTHSVRGEASTAVAVDTFTVANFRFDTDGSAATQVDTAKIFQGETILWRWVGGSHTTTSGFDDTDPQAGVLFDHPISNTLGNTSFAFQFNSVGTVPFFCSIHPASMKGVVVVRSTTSVDPVANAAGVGFLSGPRPNPTTGIAAFRFGLASAGHARVEVFDVRGRRMAVPLDRDLGAGGWEAAWDGRGDGARVPPGIYYLRLTVPGRVESRKVVVSR